MFDDYKEPTDKLNELIPVSVLLQQIKSVKLTSWQNLEETKTRFTEHMKRWQELIGHVSQQRQRVMNLVTRHNTDKEKNKPNLTKLPVQLPRTP